MKGFLLGAVIVAAILAVSGVVGYGALTATPHSASAPIAAVTPTNTVARPTPTPKSYNVVYRVMTLPPCGDFAVTYRLPDGTVQKDARICPEENVINSFTAHSGDSLYLSAQNQWHPENRKKYTCQILVDGNVISEIESVGFASTATCEGVAK